MREVPRHVVVGESLVDIVVPVAGESSERVGGSPMNVAVGLARLGVPTLLLTQVGDDDRGRRVVEHVESSGAVVSPSSVQTGTTTSTATARLDADHAATYEFDLTWTLPEQELPDTTALHVGSLGAGIDPGRQAVLGLVRQAAEREVLVSFDPNVRPAFVTDRDAAWRDVAETATLSTLVKVSDEDLAVLRPGEPPAALAAELLAGRRTELVIVTMGAAGSWAFTAQQSVEADAPRIDVVDTVGAGDSFMAAALAVLHEWRLVGDLAGRLAALGSDDLRSLLGHAMAAAAVTCSRRGANPPTRRELPPGWGRA